jgi:hypothetical protein
MSVETLIPNIRAGLRQRLLGMALPSVTINTAATLSGATLSAPLEPGLNFSSAFSPGEYVVMTGDASGENIKTKLMIRVGVNDIEFDSTLTTQGLNTVTVAIPMPDLALENEKYTPLSGRPFVNESVRNVSSKAGPMGGIIRHTILMTLTLFYPPERGTLGIERMAGRLVKRFAAGQKIEYGDSAAVITDCEMKPMLREPEWLQCPVTASLIAWTLNSRGV